MRKLISGLCAVWGALGVAHAQEILPRHDFEREVISVIVAPRVVDAVSDGPGTVAFTIDDPLREWPLAMGEAYARYSADPMQLDAIRAEFGHIPTPEFELRAERLVIVLRNDSFVMDAGRDALAQPFMGDLQRMLAFDRGNVLEFATRDSLHRVGLREREAWRRAAENLPSIMGPEETATIAPGLTVVSHPGWHAPSALLARDVCEGEDADFRNFLVSSRGAYFRADEREGSLMEPGGALIFMLRDYVWRNEQTMSRAVLSCEGGQLEAHMPPE